MHIAAAWGRTNAMQLLKEWGGDVSAKDNVSIRVHPLYEYLTPPHG